MDTQKQAKISIITDSVVRCSEFYENMIQIKEVLQNGERSRDCKYLTPIARFDEYRRTPICCGCGNIITLQTKVAPPMSLTKEHLIISVHNHLNLPKPKSADLVESLLEIIKSTLASGENIMISGFGKFCVRDKKERKGVRNPKTGEGMMLRARRVIVFKCSRLLRDIVE